MRRLAFISYSHVDSELVDALTRRLRRNGIDLFLDRKDIEGGHRISIEVQKALEECFAVIVVVSPATCKSQWVPYEIGYASGANAMGDNKKILPLLTHPSVEPPQFLLDLKRFTCVDDIVRYFKSDSWRLHCDDTEARRSNELRAVRKAFAEALAKADDWFERYKPGGGDPEEL